ncbi:MAG: DUF6066 family protein [Cystobacterineae bacterium]|nr:DUF6066 family protein [Cystobacterineae bacterium]
MNKISFKPLVFIFFFSFLGVSAKASEHRQERLFNELRENSKKIDSLSSFLKMYMGDCQASAEASECRQKSAVFQRQANQSSYVFFAFEDSIALEIRPVSEEQFNISWLPFFSAFGYGLSSQPPKQWSKEGLPFYSFMQIRGQLPPEGQVEEIIKWNKFGRLAAEVIVTPRGTWKAAPKGKAPLEGMKVIWKAIRIFDSRSGQTVGIWLNH